jgi:hypothetical protein
MTTSEETLAATDPLATPADVRREINTDLDGSALTDRIESAYEDIALATDIEQLNDLHRRKLETYYTAYLIRAWTDRDIEKGDRESVSLTYDGSALEELERKVQSLDPSGDLLPGEDGDASAGGLGGVGERRASYGSGRPYSASDTHRRH